MQGRVDHMTLFLAAVLLAGSMDMDELTAELHLQTGMDPGR